MKEKSLNMIDTKRFSEEIETLAVWILKLFIFAVIDYLWQIKRRT